MLPHVTLHNAVSLDGRLLEWGMVDMGLCYGLVGAVKEDATLAGARTLLAGAEHEGVSADPSDAVPVETAAGDSRPLLVVPDAGDGSACGAGFSPSRTGEEGWPSVLPPRPEST